MKLDNISFPHPVLGLTTNDHSPSEEIDVMGLFEVSQTLEISDKLIVRVDYSLLNSRQLTRLIEAGNASFACEVSCAKTAYRCIFTEANPKHEFIIPLNSLRDQIVFQYFIVALQPFDYQDEGGWHPDYKGQTFEIQRGMVLAYGGEVKHMLERSEMASPRGMSLIAINPGEAETGPYEIDLNGESINIFLPKKTFMSFDVLYSNNSSYSINFHAALVIPALVYALTTMGSETSRDYRDKKWFQALETKLSKDDRFRDIAIADLTTSKALEVAQILVGLPFSKLTETLTKNSTPDDEY